MFHFDFADCNQMLSFDMFLVRFEAMLVNTLIEHRETLFPTSGKHTAKDGGVFAQVLKVATRFYDRNLLEKELAHSINRVMASQNGHSYAYSIDKHIDIEAANELAKMVEQYKNKDYKKTVFVTDFERVAKLLARLTPESEALESWSDKDLEFACGLRLLHDAVISKELSRRPA